jgi:hypothetical protein
MEQTNKTMNMQKGMLEMLDDDDDVISLYAQTGFESV